MKFSEIPQFTSVGSYEVDIPLRFLERQLKEYEEGYGLDLNPDFQRGHVWTKEQQIAWLEFYFRGGKTGRVIYFNTPAFSVGYQRGRTSDLDETMLCVDGLQRLTALRAFLNNEIPIFGVYYNEFEDKLSVVEHYIKFNVNCLQTRKEVLQWYIEMNSGGTPHSQAEIERVKRLLEEEG